MAANVLLNTEGTLRIDAAGQAVDVKVFEIGSHLVVGASSDSATTKYTTFDKSRVQEIVFQGSQYNDAFVNYTGIEDWIYGHQGNDRLTGGAGKSHIEGGIDNDIINGGDGDDTISGNPGNDSIFGGGGNDAINGGWDQDWLWGDDGNDVVRGGPDDARDTIHGGNGNDEVFGGGGNDTLFGDDQDDKLHGEGGNDSLDGGDGNDSLAGGQGDDHVSGRTGDDIYHFDVDMALGSDLLDDSSTGFFSFFAGRDTLDFSSGSTGIVLDLRQSSSQAVHRNLQLTLGSTLAFEVVIGTSGNDTIWGTWFGNRLEGRAGNDHLWGEAATTR